MTGIRRALLLLGVLTVALGITTPAHATFSATAGTTAATVSTITVLPPGPVSTAGSVCSSGTLQLELAWTKSPTTRISGYRVRMYTNTGINWNLGTVGAGQTGYDAAVSVRVNGKPTTYQFTVTTTTTYGWTAESDRTGAITC